MHKRFHERNTVVNKAFFNQALVGCPRGVLPLVTFDLKCVDIFFLHRVFNSNKLLQMRSAYFKQHNGTKCTYTKLKGGFSSVSFKQSNF